jgi:hypothetical protein
MANDDQAQQRQHAIKNKQQAATDHHRHIFVDLLFISLHKQSEEDQQQISS